MPQPVSLSAIITAIDDVIADLQELGNLGSEYNARRANVIAALGAISTLVTTICDAEGGGENGESYIPLWAVAGDQGNPNRQDVVSSGQYVRRAPFVVLYWRDDRLCACNYATGRTVELQPRDVQILERTSKWTARDAVECDCVAEKSASTIDALVDNELLETTDRRSPRAQRLFQQWRGWNPAAGFFHMATKHNTSWPPTQKTPAPFVVLQSAVPHEHRFPDRPTIELPEFRRDDVLASTLRARRTWRRFGETPLSPEQLSDLLGMTFGIQSWMELDGERVPLRTAPSGGARHSLEAYVLALDVEGFDAGVYHYCPGSHTLALLDGTVDRDTVASFFPHESGFDRAAAVIFMTSVFGRVQRKYDQARAYRVVLLEAGHFCQSFCLLATHAGLAPFCTAAFSDHAVEQLLGVDGVSESVVYAMGVGTRPEGAAWAPWPDGAAPPELSAPEYAARFAR